MFRVIPILLILFMLGSLGSPGLAKPALKIDSPVPELILPTLKGEYIHLSSYRGRKNVILIFFSNRSKTCEEELKFLQALYKKYKRKGLEIIAVSLNKKISKVQPFVDKNKLTFTILIDKKYKYLDDFRILIIPTTFSIDKNGILKNIYVHFDGNIKKVLEKEVKKLL